MMYSKVGLELEQEVAQYRYPLTQLKLEDEGGRERIEYRILKISVDVKDLIY